VTHILEGERVFLRPFEPTDAETYRRWRDDAATMALAGWPDRGPMSLAAVEARIDRLTREPADDFITYVICALDDERPLGEVMLHGIDRVNGNAEIGIFIGEAAEWGKGYGTDAVNTIVDFGFSEMRLERIALEVWTENPRAQRAYEKAGFIHEGTQRHDRYEAGVYTDGHMMSLLRDEWLALPRRSRAR
jgi:RimJ/RimL family protein N-acetyltransferase